MGRVSIQGVLLIAFFFGVYATMKRVDWMSLFDVKSNVDKTEKKLGDALWKIFKKSDDELKSKLVESSVDSILTRLCDHNDIDRESLKVHILDNNEVNAFALPDRHLVVYSGLIAASENPEELAGVLAHELAHIELDHVMKKLVKEIGLSVLISVTTGSGGGEIAKEIARTLSSSAFDRKQEKEADMKAVDYMVEADIDAEPFGEFLYRLGGKGGKIAEYLAWISTHPDSRERGEYIVGYAREKSYSPVQLLAEETWENVGNELKPGH